MKSFFGNGLVGVGLTAVPTIAMTYVSDCYLPVNAAALTVAIGLKVSTRTRLSG